MDLLSSKAQLHRKREHYIKKELVSFIHKHGYQETSPEVNELRQRLEKEADRVFPMIDKSIFKERKKRAVKTFFLTSIPLGIFALLTGGALIPVFVSAFVAAFTSVATIDISYYSRVEGAMASVRSVFEIELQKKQNIPVQERVKVAGGADDSLDTKAKPLGYFANKVAQERKARISGNYCMIYNAVGETA